MSIDILGIGALGSIQNVISAGASRTPSALGVRIRDTGNPLRGSSIASVLRIAEENYPGVGMSLVPVFFPGSLRVKEPDIEFWRKAQERTLGPNQ